MRALLRLLATLAAVLWGLAAAAQDSGQPDQPVLRMEFAETKAIPGQPLTLRLTVLVPTFMPKPPVWPGLEMPDVMVRLPGRATSPVSHRINGQEWAGLTRRYQVFPMVPGSFSLPSQDVPVTYADPDTNAPVQAVLKTDPIRFEGILPEGAADLNPFIAADELTLKMAVGGDPEAMQPGDSLSVTVTAQAKGLAPMFLPQLLPQISIPGIAAYPGAPLLEETETRGSLSGSRTEQVVLLAEGGGRGEVPAVELRWYDLQSGTVQTARSEGFEVWVDGPPARSSEPRDWRQIMLRFAGASAAAAVMAAALRLAWPWGRRLAARLKSVWEGSERQAFGQVRATVRSRDHGGLLRALEIWAVRTRAGPAVMRHDALTAALLQLGRVRYGAGGSAPGGGEEAAAWRELAAAAETARSWAAKGPADTQGALGPLNPGR